MKKLSALFLLFLLPFAKPLNLNACGPFFPSAMFVYSMHPDFPLDSYAAGGLGIVQPTYARSYLYVAYRYLTGGSFNKEERADMVRLWEERMNLQPLDVALNVQPWLDARKEISDLPAVEGPEAFKEIDYQSFVNCTYDAFAGAADTLRNRVKTFGAANPAVRDWVAAQDLVFANCNAAPDAPPSIPQPAAAAAPAILKADRNYQTAAAYFYAGNFAEARKRFQEISKDTASPWKNLASYLVVRCMIRQATIGAGFDKPADLGLLRESETTLQQLSAEFEKSKQEDLLLACERLLNYVKVRVTPETRAGELAAALLKADIGTTIYQDLWDYTTALDKLVEVEQLKPDEMTDWIYTFQLQEPRALESAMKRWKQGGSLPWLVAVISKIPATHASVPEVLAAAEKVKSDSPAFLTIAYHRARLLSGTGKQKEAREWLDSVLGNSRLQIPATAVNRLLALRMKLAENMDEFLRYAQRKPAAVGADYTGLEMAETDSAAGEPPVLVDSDGAAVLNARMPLEAMEAAARNQKLDAELRKRLLAAVWVRAVLLDRMDAAVRLAPDIQPMIPGSEALWKAITDAKDPAEAKFAAIFLLLKTPGLEPELRDGLPRETAAREIDDYRDNWWCAQTPEPDAAATFLDEPARAAAAAELEKLIALGPAPNVLAQQAVLWAAAHTDDPRSPEALYLAVKSTRFGCTDEKTKNFSRQAFQLLHKNWPKSEWARKTPYYY